MTLRKWLELPGKAQGWTIQSVADALGRNRTHISRFTNGHTVPRPRDVVAIYHLTDGLVGPADWYPDIKVARDRMRSAAAQNTAGNGVQA